MSIQKNLIKVSVCVISYEHEKYISNCLDSIISQKNDFEIEIIIRDDCSKDNSANIISDYAIRYPSLIKVLDGRRNIGMNANLLTVLNSCSGDYIAICEGDDFWLDDQKLAKQVSFMDINSDVSFCVHSCKLYKKNKLTSVAFNKSSKVEFFGIEDILACDGQFSPTASYLFVREVVNQLPLWFATAPVGDLFIELYALTIGKGAFLTEPMSAYRIFSVGSWSDIARRGEQDKLIARMQNLLFCLTLVKNDMPSYELFIERKIEFTYYGLAIRYLLNDDIPNFEFYLGKYLVNNTGGNLYQKSILLFSKYPNIIKLIHNLKSFIYKVFKIK
jgi:glycosyltransferase involved in cell wall biosynthesis